ncbi:hypothetical protein I6E29_09210 [Arcanobacterium haemolyticum]|nr:hypothetical protein [Arcanobacterium haemolyticum]
MYRLMTTYPVARFYVTMPADEATFFLSDIFKKHDFSDENLQLTHALRRYFPSEKWCGLTLRKGNDWKSGFLEELSVQIPFLLLIPGVRRAHKLMRIACVARAIPGTEAAEVLVGLMRSVSPKEKKIFRSIAEECVENLRRAGVLREAFDIITAFDLPETNPFSPRNWNSVQKEARSHQEH